MGTEPDCFDAERLEVRKLRDQTAQVSETVAIVVLERGRVHLQAFA